MALNSPCMSKIPLVLKKKSIDSRILHSTCTRRKDSRFPRVWSQMRKDTRAQSCTTGRKLKQTLELACPGLNPGFIIYNCVTLNKLLNFSGLPFPLL